MIILVLPLLRWYGDYIRFHGERKLISMARETINSETVIWLSVSRFYLDYLTSFSPWETLQIMLKISDYSRALSLSVDWYYSISNPHLMWNWYTEDPLIPSPPSSTSPCSISLHSLPISLLYFINCSPSMLLVTMDHCSISLYFKPTAFF